MEGYSVEEAATVLGVPKGRVWELLARGVLAGTPEDGGGMRVYLRGQPFAPPAESSPGLPSHSGEGNGHRSAAEALAEASPFRELLTEFRNLTERYGQALLALGESRGEVAGLRARVEVLEARLDLRLPGPSGWSAASTPPLEEPSEPAAHEEPPEVGSPEEPMAEVVAEEPLEVGISGGADGGGPGRRP